MHVGLGEVPAAVVRARLGFSELVALGLLVLNLDHLACVGDCPLRHQGVVLHRLQQRNFRLELLRHSYLGIGRCSVTRVELMHR